MSTFDCSVKTGYPHSKRCALDFEKGSFLIWQALKLNAFYHFILWPMPLFLKKVNTQTMHIKSIIHNNNAMITLKSRVPWIRTRVFRSWGGRDVHWATPPRQGNSNEINFRACLSCRKKSIMSHFFIECVQCCSGNRTIDLQFLRKQIRLSLHTYLAVLYLQQKLLSSVVVYKMN
jgi:hypothetical protein